MSFVLTEDQQLLRESAERFVAEHYAFERRNAIVASEPGCDEEVWRAFADLGWLGMTVPERFGGLGVSQADRLVLFEALGRALIVEPLIPSAVLAPELIARSANDEQCEQMLGDTAAGRWRATVAFLEPGGRHNPALVSTRAERTARGYALSGAKSAVLGAPQAHAIVVSARTAGDARDRAGVSLFVVPREARGLKLRAFGTIDGARAAEVVLESVEVGEEARLGAEGEGLEPLEHAVDLAAAAACAEALGAIRALNSITAEYLRTRRQFGQPLGAFQALQHRMADMRIAEQRVTSLLAILRLKLDAADARARQRIVSAAKAQVGRCGRYVGQQAVQLHGGIGVSEELIVGHYFRRLTAIEASYGDTAWHLERVATSSGN